MVKLPGTMEELESQAVLRLTAIGRQLWAILMIVVVVSAGAAAWMTQTDMRLSGVEHAVTLLSTGAVADMQGRLRAAEKELLIVRSEIRAMELESPYRRREGGRE